MSLFGSKSKDEQPINMADVTELKPGDPTDGQDMKAKKDFVISHNDYYREIKAGDDLSDVPDTYWPNLKTEGVI